MVNVIRSIRKGTAQWNEEDRLKIATLLLKAGYSVRIGRQLVPEGKKNQMEYTVEYWEGDEHGKTTDKNIQTDGCLS